MVQTSALKWSTSNGKWHTGNQVALLTLTVPTGPMTVSLLVFLMLLLNIKKHYGRPGEGNGNPL